MDNFTLKIVALVGTLLSNIALLFVNGSEHYYLYFMLRGLGFMAIPVICFMVVEGVYHTTNIKKYLARLFGFALLAEAPYITCRKIVLMNFVKGMEKYLPKELMEDESVTFSDKMNQFKDTVGDRGFEYFKDLFDSSYYCIFNGLFTVFMAAVMVLIIKKLSDKFIKTNRLLFILSTSLIMLAFVAVCAMLAFESPIYIILFSAMFFYLRGNRAAIAIMSVLMMLMLSATSNMLTMTGVVVGVLVIFSYNGRPGQTNTNKKYIFYFAYVAQLLILSMLKTYVF